MKMSVPRLFPYFSILLLMGQLACSEEFQTSPPFPNGVERSQLDNNDFVYIGKEPQLLDDQPVFPFSYQVFDERFEGFLANGGERLYTIGLGESFSERIPFFDFSLQKGDTLHKYTPRKYHIIIDKRTGEGAEEIYFVLRRTRRGISDLEERQVWVISTTRGVIAIASYEIDPFIGNVTLDMIGDSEWFRDKSITRLIKYHDYTRAVYMDVDRSLMYEFNKITGIIKCRDVKEREEIHRYQFNNPELNALEEFYILPQDRGVILRTADSCYYFSETLNLDNSGACP